MGRLKNIFLWMLFGFLISFVLVFISRIPYNLFIENISFFAYWKYAFVAGLISAGIFLIIGIISEFYLKKDLKEFFKFNKYNISVTLILFIFYFIGTVLISFALFSVYLKYFCDILLSPTYLLFLGGLLGNSGWYSWPWYQSYLFYPLIILFWYYSFVSLIIHFFRRLIIKVQ